MNYNEFINTYNGQSFDYDGVSGVQCVDLIKMYLNKVFGLAPGAWGNAKDYYENYNNNSVLKANFDRIANTPEFVPQKGDIAVWGAGPGNTYGHVAIATGEGNTSNFYTYDLNWNGKTVKKVKHTYKGFLGVLRPKDQSKIGTETVVENNSNKEEFEMAKKWVNGSTNEDVYADVNLTKKIGTIYPRGEADCYAEVDGKYLVCYNVYSGGSVANRKTGFVKYNGGL